MFRHFRPLSAAAMVFLFVAACANNTAEDREALAEDFGDGDRIGELSKSSPSQRDDAAEALSGAELMKLPRDARRTKIISGFVCNKNIYGQSGFIRFGANGNGSVGHQEGSTTFTWKVANDQLCLAGRGMKNKCHKLPSRDLPNERETILKWLGKGCY